MTRTISSRESSCLANCSLLHVSVHCRVVFVQSVQGANVVPIASAMTATHRDRPAVASVAQWPEILHLLSRGQIASTDLP